MGRKLSEMSLEELWQLFPIILTEHQDAWAAWYREEEYELALTIHLIEYFKDFVYDSKYFYHHSEYLKLLDDWYNDLMDILDYLKENIQSFYLS